MPRVSVAAVAAAGLVAACSRTAEPTAAAIGDVARGQDLVARIGCGSCHQIPGVSGADGRVGPPLTGIDRLTWVSAARICAGMSSGPSAS